MKIKSFDKVCEPRKPFLNFILSLVLRPVFVSPFAFEALFSLTLVPYILFTYKTAFPDSSYGSSVVVNARTTSVSESLLNDKELPSPVGKLESEKVRDERSEPPSPSIVHSSDKVCGEYENERESDSIYAPVDSYQSQNNIFYDYQAGDLPNWPYDLSRTRPRTQSDFQLQYQSSDANLNFRNSYSSYNGAMKGNLMTLSHFNDYLSPPSSVSSSSGYDLSDANNNSYINIEQAFHLSTIDDVIREELKNENCFLVEDGSGGSYTTLTNASAPAPLDLYLHDYPRNYAGAHNHSTSSGGDSRSPDGYGNDDYENNGFPQLTNLTTRSNGIYASSPNQAGDLNIMSYDSTHVLSPTRWVDPHLLLKTPILPLWWLFGHPVDEWQRECEAGNYFCDFWKNREVEFKRW